MSAYDRFYDADVRIFKIEQGGGYSRSEKEIELCNIKADVQPYVITNSIRNDGMGIARELYGLDMECQARMYSAECADVKEGNYAEVNGVKYLIVYAAHWSAGIEALLKKELM